MLSVLCCLGVGRAINPLGAPRESCAVFASWYNSAMKRSAPSKPQNPSASGGKASTGRAPRGKPSARRDTVITATAPCRVDLAGGTVDIWPLYLFHPGAVTVNVAVEIRTRCRIAAAASPEIHLSSIDTGLEDRFASFEAFRAARRPRHALAAHLLRFFLQGRLWG